LRFVWAIAPENPPSGGDFVLDVALPNSFPVRPRHRVVLV
jgi:hypothetical protein